MEEVREDLGGRLEALRFCNECAMWVQCNDYDSEESLWKESRCFLAYGQAKMGINRDRTPRYHNAALRRNPRSVKFRKNVCPYNERLNHGLIGATYGCPTGSSWCPLHCIVGC